MSSIDSYFDKNISLAQAYTRSGLTEKGKEERFGRFGMLVTSITIAVLGIAALAVLVPLTKYHIIPSGYDLTYIFGISAVLGGTIFACVALLLLNTGLNDTERKLYLQIPPVKQIPASSPAPIDEL